MHHDNKLMYSYMARANVLGFVGTLTNVPPGATPSSSPMCLCAHSLTQPLPHNQNFLRQTSAAILDHQAATCTCCGKSNRATFIAGQRWERKQHTRYTRLSSSPRTYFTATTGRSLLPVQVAGFPALHYSVGLCNISPTSAQWTVTAPRTALGARVCHLRRVPPTMQHAER